MYVQNAETRFLQLLAAWHGTIDIVCLDTSLLVHKVNICLDYNSKWSAAAKLIRILKSIVPNDYYTQRQSVLLWCCKWNKT